MESKPRYSALKGEKKRVCAVCGKEFASLPDYSYKKRIRGTTYKWYCSYGCYRKENN